MEKLNEDEMWAIIGFIKVSQTRYATLKALEDNFLMPSEIAKKTNIRVTQISNSLHDLKEKNLVECKKWTKRGCSCGRNWIPKKTRKQARAGYIRTPNWALPS